MRKILLCLVSEKFFLAQTGSLDVISSSKYSNSSSSWIYEPYKNENSGVGYESRDVSEYKS